MVKFLVFHRTYTKFVDDLDQSYWVVFIVDTLYFGRDDRSEVSDPQEMADKLTNILHITFAISTHKSKNHNVLIT